VREQPVIRLRGVGKTYHEGDAEHVVLHGIDLDIRRGEFVALLGPSGSGNSTLLNVIGGIDEPSAGTVAIDDVGITQLGERDRTLFRRSHIGFVFQFFNLLPTLTVEENILLPLELNGKKAGAAARVRELLDAVGLRARADSYPDRLSGGEQQRVAIARALAHDPPLLLADEPTGNLDSETGAHVLQLLQDLTRGAQKTVLIVTHSPEVIHVSDRVLHLRDGSIFEDTAP
jgi:putative ABC transport system ATP-binding protein